MNAAIATRWIKALRSGKYKQGKNALKYTTAKKVTRHCCLGVLCELYNQDKKRKQKPTLSVRPESNEIDNLPARSTAYAFSGNATSLPAKVMKWAGMNSAVGEIGRSGETLAEMNDDGVSFKKIADVIELKIDKL